MYENITKIPEMSINNYLFDKRMDNVKHVQVH